MEWKSEWTAPTVAGVISFGVGAALGYAVGARIQYKKIQNSIDAIEETATELESDMVRVNHKLDDRTEHISQALEYAWNIVGQVVPDDPELQADDPELEESVTNHPTSSALPMIPMSVFPDYPEEGVEEDTYWNYNEEIANRTPDFPFIIHADEYEDDEGIEYSKSTLTYYAGDNILADDQGVPVYNPEKVVGKLNFGHGSNDPSICFVRNDRLQADYEVIIDHGYFVVEVLGEEIQHDLSRNREELHKFRLQD